MFSITRAVQYFSNNHTVQNHERKLRHSLCVTEEQAEIFWVLTESGISKRAELYEYHRDDISLDELIEAVKNRFQHQRSKEKKSKNGTCSFVESFWSQCRCFNAVSTVTGPVASLYDSAVPLVSSPRVYIAHFVVDFKIKIGFQNPKRLPISV